MQQVLPVPSKETTDATTSPVISKFLAVSNTVAVAALPVISLLIVAGSLSSLIVPVVIFAALDKLVAVVAVPVKLPVNEVAVTTPVRFTLPVPVISLLLTSKSPPSCGVVSPTISVVIPVRAVKG